MRFELTVSFSFIPLPIDDYAADHLVAIGPWRSPEFWMFSPLLRLLFTALPRICGARVRVYDRKNNSLSLFLSSRWLLL